jgi:hypothetical protein
MRHLVSVLPAIALALIASTGIAQPVTGASCPYESCGVRLQANFFGEHLVRGDSGEKVLKIGFTGSNVADYLSRVESARVPARQFQARRTRAAVLGIISGVALGYAYGAGMSDDGFGDDPGADVYIALGVSIPTAIWGAVEAARSRNAISRAIWEFNRAPVR